MSRRTAYVLSLSLLALSACERAPSAFDTRGVRAAQIAELGWLLFILAGGVFAIVLIALGIALFRRREGAAADLVPGSSYDRPAAVGGTSLIVLGGVAMPAVVLTVLLVITLRAMGALARPEQPPAFTIEVVGHQFWWEVRYPDQGFVTANELHIPVGEPVQVRLLSYDVIHSFWVPQLMGKHDMTPGHPTATWIQADQPGIYRGECAEYCGIQHAKMYFFVVAEPPTDFQVWVERQQQPAAEPTDPFLQRGAAAFARERCIECHAIRYGGRDQATGGNAGPDLTHVGSRLTLAAGILDNNLGNMAGWIGNPQAIKPGNRMPAVPMDGESLRAIAAYLESLK